MYKKFVGLLTSLAICLPLFSFFTPSASASTKILCHNMTGGDRSYAVCRKYSVVHEPSDIKLTVDSFNRYYVSIDIEGADKERASISQGRIITVMANNGTKVRITHKYNTAINAVTLKLETVAVKNTDDTDNESVLGHGNYKTMRYQKFNIGSELRIKPLFFNCEYVRLSITGSDTDLIRLNKGESRSITTENGVSYRITYIKKYGQYAYFSINSETRPDLPKKYNRKNSMNTVKNGDFSADEKEYVKVRKSVSTLYLRDLQSTYAAFNVSFAKIQRIKVYKGRYVTFTDNEGNKVKVEYKEYLGDNKGGFEIEVIKD